MSNWGNVLEETMPNKDKILNRYVKRLAQLRKRNVVVYYSNWLNNSSGKVDINDSDQIGFMNAFNGLDKTKGLDLILHTPGGSPTATEGISKYMHNLFGNDINVFVPHMCMSTGTLLACSSTKIIMGKESFLGPVDPQFNGIPAFDIKKEIENAKQELAQNPSNYQYWEIQLRKYPAAYLYIVQDAINLTSVLLNQWLESYMFAGYSDEQGKKDLIKRIVAKLNNNSHSHARHFDINDCKEMGLLVEPLEANQEIQDAVLSIYHACSIISGDSSKLITNNKGQTYFLK